MIGKDQLSRLADLLHRHNRIGSEIAAFIGRPAACGHIGEFIAAALFGIRLNSAANERGHDGFFESGPLAGRSVNVKYYAKGQGLLDLCEIHHPDLYLVLTGPRSGAVSSRGDNRPFVIDSVYLFESEPLLAALREYGVKLGIATSVRKHLWQAAEIFPTATCRLHEVSASQAEQLRHFASNRIGA